jgi:hypothetical protein
LPRHERRFGPYKRTRMKLGAWPPVPRVARGPGASEENSQEPLLFPMLKPSASLYLHSKWTLKSTAQI